MAKLTRAEKEVLTRITPGKLPDFIEKTLEKVRLASGKEVMLGGSTAKGTFLADDHDIDVFVRYDAGIDDISTHLERALKKIFPRVARVHGSRDYFHVSFEEYTFEFVPVKKISSHTEVENVTDMSPLHVAYVTERLTPDLAAQIRLAKQFMKAAKVYGAESYIGGFSGHVTELLVLHFKGFRELLKAASEWDPPIIIDPEHHHKDPKAALNEQKSRTPLILIDPVQPERNAAAALTKERLSIFSDRAHAYLATEDPEKFFTIEPLDAEAIARALPNAETLTVRFRPAKSKRDVMGARAAKVFEFIARALGEHGFTTIDAQWEFQEEEAMFIFVLNQGPLPDTHDIIGPPIDMPDAVARFKEHHADTFEEGGRIVAREKRAFTIAKALISNIANTQYIAERGRIL